MKHLSDYEVAKIAHVAEKETYDAGQYIVREKSVGDTFYIIVRGSCDVFQLQSNNTQKLINKLKAGEHFGEKALLNDNDLRNAFDFTRFRSQSIRPIKIVDKIITERFQRTATVQASTDVQCLTLMRADVIRLIGNLQDIYPNEGQVLEKQLSKPKQEEQDPDISLANLAVMSILGEGGFGKDS